jgi:hypothetical protein
MDGRDRLRYAWLFVGVLLLGLAGGYVAQGAWATATWFWPDSRLSYIFVGSVLAAVAMTFLAVAVSGEHGALASGGLTGFVMSFGVASYLVQLATVGQRPALLLNAIVAAAIGLLGIGLFWWVRRIPIRDQRPVPRLLRVALATFVGALLLAATLLIVRLPTVFPWPLNPDSSVIFGWIFLGNATFYGYALLSRYWPNARGPLLSFLAYDLVLIPPFLSQFGAVRPDHRLSLILYTAVLFYSALVSSYYLFVNPTTRGWAVRPVPARQPDRRPT